MLLARQVPASLEEGPCRRNSIHNQQRQLLPGTVQIFTGIGVVAAATVSVAIVIDALAVVSYSTYCRRSSLLLALSFCLLSFGSCLLFLSSFLLL